MKGLRLYVLLISIAALLAVAALSVFAGAWTRPDVIAAAFFASLGILAQVLGYQQLKGRAGTIAFLPFLSIAAVSPNSAAIASVFAAMLFGELIAKRDFLKAQFNTSQQVLAVATAELAYVALGGKSLLDTTVDFPVFFAAFFALFATYMAVNKAVVAFVLSLVNKTAFRRELVRGTKGALVNDLLALPLVVVFALAYARFELWTAILALPMLGIRQLFKTVMDLERINEELLQLMVAAIEARDPYTSGHSQRVARYSRVIARVVGLNSRQVEEIGTAALLHDVGKIHEEFAPILRQPRKLTDAEYEFMKTHSAKGAVLVSTVSQFKNIVVPAVRGHHEAWGGTGYPDALIGDAIPLGARIITIADTIDAMTTIRPYRPARSLAEVRAELFRLMGVQFDPKILAALFAVENWEELCLEVEIAAREFPADVANTAFVSDEFPIHSTQFRVH